VSGSGCGAGRAGTYGFNCANVRTYLCLDPSAQCAISTAGSSKSFSFTCGNGVTHSSSCSVGGTPCFAHETSTACRLAHSGISPADAFDACYADAPVDARVATRLKMSELVAGDYVLDTTQTASAVLLNQHARVARSSALVRLTTSTGEVLELTPDHVLMLDGAWQPASEAIVGSSLSTDGTSPSSRVISHTRHHGRVVNPLVASGQILAGGPTGLPFRATVTRDGLERLFLPESLVEHSLFNALASRSPDEAQAFNDEWLEQAFDGPAADFFISLVQHHTPSRLIPLVAVGLDAAFTSAFLLFYLSTTTHMATLFISICLSMMGVVVLRKRAQPSKS